MGLMELLVRLGLDATGYETGLKKAQSSARSFGHELSSAVGNKISSIFGAAAIEEGFRKTIEWGHKLKDLSLRTGIPIEELQKLEYAAEMTGTSLEAVVKAVEKFGKSQAAARKEGPGGDKFDAMKRMGLSDADINSGDFVTNFYKAAEHMKGAAQSAQLVADWTSIAGKNAMEIAPAIREGLAGFAKELEKAGNVVPTDQILTLAAASENLHKIWISIRTTIAEVFNLAAGAGNFFGDLLSGTVGGLYETLQSMKESRNPLKNIGAFGTGFSNNYFAGRDKRAAHKQEMEDKLNAPRGTGSDAETKGDKKAAKTEAAEAKEIERIHERIAEIRRRTGLIGLDDAAKLKKIEEEIAANKKEWADNPADAAQLDLKQAQLEEERARLMAGMAKKKDSFTLKPGHDSLIDVGNYLGANSSNGIVDKLDVVHKDLRDIVKNTMPGLGGSDYPGS